eukprot:COSAG02_NODE_1685_length_11320_cov_4.020408_3_plen_191_part_00
MASFFGYGPRRRAGERRLGRLTVPGRPARARPGTPETAFGFRHPADAGLTLTGAAELPGALSIARFAQQAVLTCVLLCYRSMELVSEICAGWRILRGGFFDRDGVLSGPRSSSSARCWAWPSRHGPWVEGWVDEVEGGDHLVGERASFRSVGGARPARAPYVSAARELAGLGSACLPAAGRWLKTWGLGC